MHAGETIHPKGCFKQLKYVAGQSLPEIECRLGFRSGRRACVVQAGNLPGLNEFTLIAYSQVPGDCFKNGSDYDPEKARAMFGHLNPQKLRQLVRASWQISGPDSLLKIIPVTPHSDRETYPSGSGAPQSEITVPLRCHMAAFVAPYGHLTLH